MRRRMRRREVETRSDEGAWCTGPVLEPRIFRKQITAILVNHLIKTQRRSVCVHKIWVKASRLRKLKKRGIAMGILLCI